MHLFLYSADLSTPVRTVAMTYENEQEWSSYLHVPSESELTAYQYAFQSEKGLLQPESGPKRRLPSAQLQDKIVELVDYWQFPTGDSPFASVAFTDCFMKRAKAELPLQHDGNIEIRLYAPRLTPAQHYAIAGNQKVLGNWNSCKKKRMDETEFPYWSIRIPASEISFPLEYKFILVDTDSDEIVNWENGANHVITQLQPETTHCIVNHNVFDQKRLNWKGAGVAIPVFSLRSEHSMGIGEFYDLKLLIDWARQTNQHVIQTLPINDTTHQHSNADSYPYNAVSVYALHPIYLRAEAIGQLKNKKQREHFEKKGHELNAKHRVEYQQVMNLKWDYFHAIFEQEGQKTFAEKEFLLFFDQNREWLVPYAAFSYLRDLYGTANFNEWPRYHSYCKEEIEELASENNPDYAKIAIHFFLQFHLHKQLSEVHAYARANSVAIKGDIPIGVSRHSADVWTEPELFDTALQTGAPPDDFSATGQNWGFPTYNWELMKQDGYRWWKKRFQKLAEYFDAYRIDHILGFFRIWGIPADAVWGLTGSFQPALPYSADELEAKGIDWCEKRYTQPYISSEQLLKLFGYDSDEVTDTFLNATKDGLFSFKHEFDSQRKVQSWFAAHGAQWGDNQQKVLDGLYMLHCEVLFVRDAHRKELFHPRIALHNSASFKALPAAMQTILYELHNDYFYQRHTEFWKQQALEKLPVLISATDMLVCGEDLGMIPDSVPDVMNELEILSLEIQRMPKKPWTEFAMPAEAPYRSVCTTSTHDMNPLRAWWLEDKEVTERFYHTALQHEGKAPEQCTPEMAREIIAQHLHSEAMLVILPWQDWRALDTDHCQRDPQSERINVPSNPNNYWCYRMHLTLEKLLQMNGLNRKIVALIEESARWHAY